MSEEKFDAQSAQAPALPDGWEWKRGTREWYAEDSRGVHVHANDGVASIFHPEDADCDAPTAVVLAVIARNAKGGGT